MNMLYNIKLHHGFWIDILLCHLMKRLNIPRSNHFYINFWKIIYTSEKKEFWTAKFQKYRYMFYRRSALNGNLYGFTIYYPYPWQNGFKVTIQTLHINKHKNEYINIQCLKKCTASYCFCFCSQRYVGPDVDMADNALGQMNADVDQITLVGIVR